jgi:hypothetical protein
MEPLEAGLSGLLLLLAAFDLTDFDGVLTLLTIKGVLAVIEAADLDGVGGFADKAET